MSRDDRISQLEALLARVQERKEQDRAPTVPPPSALPYEAIAAASGGTGDLDAAWEGDELPEDDEAAFALEAAAEEPELLFSLPAPVLRAARVQGFEVTPDADDDSVRASGLPPPPFEPESRARLVAPTPVPEASDALLASYGAVEERSSEQIRELQIVAVAEEEDEESAPHAVAAFTSDLTSARPLTFGEALDETLSL